MDQKQGTFQMITAGNSQFSLKYILHFACLPYNECLFLQSTRNSKETDLFPILDKNLRKLSFVR